MDNLKPCPFCGGEAEIVLDIEYKGDNAIECQNCGVLLSVCDEDIEPLIFQSTCPYAGHDAGI